MAHRRISTASVASSNEPFAASHALLTPGPELLSGADFSLNLNKKCPDVR
jgi:hypothetical protein